MRVNIPYRKEVSFVIDKLADGSESKDKGIITGYASTFKNVDRHRDVMMKGCFEKSLKETKGKIPVLYNHYKQVGINMSASEDEKGLFVSAKIFNDSEDLKDAKEAWALVKANQDAGSPMGLSIGGRIKDYNVITKDGKMVYQINEFDLMEYSIVPIPANPKASILNNKDFSISNLDSFNTIKEENTLLIKQIELYKAYVENLEALLKTKEVKNGSS